MNEPGHATSWEGSASAVSHSAEALTPMLVDWLPRQRWFAGKHHQIATVHPIQSVVLHDDGGEPSLEHLVVAVASEAHKELYQLLVGYRRHLPERLEHAAIGVLPDGRHAYDAVHDTDLTRVLLGLLASDARFAGVRFTREPGAELLTDLTSRPVLGEQSNTSVVFGDEYVLKLFRRLGRGTSPELELHRALGAVGSTHIAQAYAAIEGELDGEQVTYGLLQHFFANCADGWAMALASVRDLMAEADLRADEVGGDFAAEAERLGHAVATVHAELATALGTDVVDPADLHRAVAAMHQRLDAVLDRVAALGPYADGIRAAFDAVTSLRTPVPIQRIHGDLHLGQVLRTVSHWVLIDFEGEPARPLAERTAMMSPLRDVAGILRSFDYASHHLLVDHPPDAQLEYRAREWTDRNRDAFCAGYAAHATVVMDPRDQPVLLRALELDKAVYEVAYELDNRPHWMEIPLRSIARSVDAT